MLANRKSSSSGKKYIHVDMDSFFVSVELPEAPWLRSRPVAVGGQAAERGVISTANYIARRFGVKSGMATATAQRLCPELILLPVRFNLYEAMTRKLDGIFRRYTSRVEFLSLDEATLDVSGQPHCNGSATYMATQIRATIEQELKLTASAGVAPLKYLAKIASEVNKPNGQFVIAPGEIDAFLSTLDIRRIPGVGPKTWGVLENLGCCRCGDVTADKIPMLLRYLGAHGFYVWERCQGKEDHEEKPSEIRSLGVEHTLPLDCHDFALCTEKLKTLLAVLRPRLSEIGEDEYIIKNYVKLKFSDFSASTAEAPALGLEPEVMHGLCRRLWNTKRQGRAVRLVGIAVKTRRKILNQQQLELSW
ncbi:DNA polymerase IV [Pseudomonas gingeri]|uniref:DNA polymerase IV n=1 Tax=Pseudomonas gingeri TaxID=117681 RepID=UPI00159F9307|nr:DNA polymerase IV [Pseudomonas gingeri]NWA03067.1 DNA polymerase IV [Pseudomonas gingeri]NWA17208.1 DNA polymerase IV [Pseudomonas gingeri]NWA57928.1 DNA polymerase IV [Pseudomonas gingeri]NWA98692.1 DNA polymerase IV [Pseudomonas gingeri]NWB02488.1 DNA polymerase IV [Pseudomonas gingeri]